MITTIAPGLRIKHCRWSHNDSTCGPAALSISSSSSYPASSSIIRMSRFTAVAAVLLVCLVVAQAAVSRVKLVNPDHPGKCVLDTNVVLSPGQKGKLPNHPCAGAYCESDGHVNIETCKAVAPPKGCRQRDFVNTNRDFPECCERKYECSKQI